MDPDARQQAKEDKKKAALAAKEAKKAKAEAKKQLQQQWKDKQVETNQTKSTRLRAHFESTTTVGEKKGTFYYCFI